MDTKRIREQLEEWEQVERERLAQELRYDRVACYKSIDWDVHFLSKKVDVMAELFEQKIDELQDGIATAITTAHDGREQPEAKMQQK